MKVKTIIIESDIKQIEKYQNIIKEIIESYIDGIDMNTATGIQQTKRAVKKIKNDTSIIFCKEMILDIYTNTVPQIVLIAENEEDKKILKEFYGMKEGGYK